MQKILIEIKDDTLEFTSLVKLKPNTSNLLNTNIISNNELLFSLSYLNENYNIVNLFIKELCQDKKIKKICISNMSLVSTICHLVNNVNI